MGLGSSFLVEALQLICWIGVTLATVTITLLKFIPTSSGSPVAPPQSFSIYSEESRLWIAMISLFVSIASQLLATAIKRFKRLPEAKIRKVMSHIVTAYFDVDSENHKSRATLFRLRHCWGLGTWLGIVARSGGRFQRKRTIFSYDISRDECNTGVAGECCRLGKTITRVAHPPEPSSDSKAAKTAWEAYRRSGWLAPQELRSMSTFATVFLASVIKKDGEIWGVIVLDSTDPAIYDAVKERSNQASVEAIAVVLSAFID